MSDQLTIDTTPESRRRLVAAWVAALRSGEYAQTKKRLHDRNGYCCFGVLCEVFDRFYPNVLRRYWEDDRENINGSFCYIPDIVRNAVGLRNRYGNTGNSTLWTMNDDGTPFAAIADLIESRPNGLFVEEAA